MNVYDTANNLASEIQKSDEYLKFKVAKEKIKSNPEIKEKIDEFETGIPVIWLKLRER